MEVQIILRMNIPKRFHSELIFSLFIMCSYTSWFCYLSRNYSKILYMHENQHGLRYCCHRNSNTCFPATAHLLELPDKYVFQIEKGRVVYGGLCMCACVCMHVWFPAGTEDLLLLTGSFENIYFSITQEIVSEVIVLLPTKVITKLNSYLLDKLVIF